MTLFLRLCDWISKVTGTILLTPCPYAVGNCAEEIYFGLLKARREKKRLVILFPYELFWRFKFRLTNIEVVNVESDYRYPLSKPAYVFGRCVITIYYGFFRILSLVRRILFGRHFSYLYRFPAVGALTLFQPTERMQEFSWDVVKSYDWPMQVREPLRVWISPGKRSLAEIVRRSMGLPDDAWFACLHVRESGFHNDQYVERNANILNYCRAIEEITGRGGWVVRMGDATMVPLPKLDRVIDYPFTSAKSALMDVYLISECRVYIGMMTGIYDVAVLLQRPMITTNMSNWMWAFPPKKGDLGLPKHVYSKSKGRFLSTREWIEEPWDAVSFRGLGDDYVLHENSPEELEEVVREFFVRGENWEPTALQLEFNERRLLRGTEILSNPIFFGENRQQRDFGTAAAPNPFAPDDFFYDMQERYRLASRLESAAGSIGSEFLRRNWLKDENA